MITLVKLSMIRFNDQGIIAPSRSRLAKMISPVDFLQRYADYPAEMPVSFEPDGYSNPQPLTVYGRGLDCWWLVKQ